MILVEKAQVSVFAKRLYVGEVATEIGVEDEELAIQSMMGAPRRQWSDLEGGWVTLNNQWTALDGQLFKTKKGIIYVPEIGRSPTIVTATIDEKGRITEYGVRMSRREGAIRNEVPEYEGISAR